MHPYNELGEGLKAFLNAEDYSQDFTAIYQPMPAMVDADTLGDELRVVTTGGEWGRDITNRAADSEDDVTMSIGIMKKLPPGVNWASDAGTTWQKTMLDFVAEVIESLDINSGDDFGNFRALTATNPTPVSPDALTKNVFQSIIQITFKRLN